MNKQEIQGAFSKIHVSDGLVEEVLSMKNEKKQICFSGQLARVAVIAAVIATLLATTAFAANTIYNALRGASTSTDGAVAVEPTGGNGGSYNYHKIRVDVDMNVNAPRSIEKYYLPQLDSGYVQYFGFVYKDRMSAYYAWTYGEENWEDEVRLWQHAGGNYDPSEVITVVHSKPGEPPETKMVELAGIQGYLAEDVFLYGTRHFIWSDGDYIFDLEVPDEYSDEDIAAVLESMTEVKDILPYCVSMTAEDREEVFG